MEPEPFEGLIGGANPPSGTLCSDHHPVPTLNGTLMRCPNCADPGYEIDVGEGCSWPDPPGLPEFTGAVLMCPVCVSTVDAVKWGWQQHTCATCSTEFTVDLRPDVVAEHAMVG